MQAQGAGTNLSYDGSFNFLTMPNNIVQNLTGDFTVEAYVFWRGGSATWGGALAWQRILDFGTSQTNYMFLVPQSNYNSRFGVMFAIVTGGVTQVIQSSTPLTMNTWVHVAVTVDNATNTGNIFINGVLDATATTTGFTLRPSMLGPTTNDWLGKSEFAGSPNFDPYFNGNIDELRISNTVRYTSNFTPPVVQFTPDANTTALFHFNEGSGQFTADATANFPDAILGTDATVDATTDPTWASMSPLPIKLSDFTVQLNQANRFVDVRWTASNDGATEYILERSANGTQFTTLHRLNKLVASNGFESFTFRDINPLPGRSYYRLKSIETGNAAVLSRIIPVSFSINETLVIYPNPVSGKNIRLELVKPYSGDMEISIFNAAGVSVYSEKTHVVNQNEFNIYRNAKITSGSYLLELKMNGHQQSKMVIFQ